MSIEIYQFFLIIYKFQNPKVWHNHHFYYSTPAKFYGDDSKHFIILFNLSKKEKIKDYKFPYHMRNIEHYCLNNIDLLIVIHDYNSIVIYDIEKDEPIKTIENPAENSVLNFAEEY